MAIPTKETRVLSKQFCDIDHVRDSLTTICNWSKPENTAIEYHDSKIIRRIKYSDLEKTKTKIKTVLLKIESQGFVAINNDVKNFCIPALILGIGAQNCGFINLPETNKQEICLRLKTTFIFSKELIPWTNLITELDVHGETLRLLKYGSEIITENDIDCDKFAYAITTSGSTGKPKIVKVSNACVVPNILDLTNILSLSNSDKIAQTTALTFDPSIVEIFLSLSSCSTLFIVSNEIINSPDKLLRLIFEHSVTVLQTTPSLWRLRWSDDEIRSTILSEQSNLRILLLGGEPFPKIETFRVMKHPNNCTRIYNIYGITEVSCWASIKEISFPKSGNLDAEVCRDLGKPLSQTVFQVRNVDGDIVRHGEGELYIGSDSRICTIENEESVPVETPVYRKTGDLVTVNGSSIFYKNRIDGVVKRLGNRIDLSELEETVLKLNFVQNCIALWDEKNHKLYLCVSTNNAVNISDKFINNLRAEEELIKELRSLPPLYQPDKIKYLTKFQLTTSGKICRKTLLKLFRNKERSCVQNKQKKSDADTVRQIFTEIWTDSLTLKTDSSSGFLENGGSSVTAIQISNKLSVALDKEFPELIGLLLNNQTLDKCLEYVTKKLRHSLGEKRTEDSTLSSPVKLIGVSKRVKYDSTHPEEVSEFDTCLWQRCRGRMTGEIMNDKLPRCSVTSKMSVAYTKDLKKCVDASPTVFKYSSGEIYTSVGSHAGMILTECLNRPDSVSYVVNLPDRIEASVLALAEFKAIIGCYDGYVYCLNLKSGKSVWKFKTGDAVKCTAILSNDNKSVFVGSYDKYFYSISVKDGSEVWKLKGSDGSISATPCTSSRTHSVAFGTLDGTCLSLNQTSGQIIWKNKFDDPVFSAPAVLENGDIIFCSVSGEVNCFQSKTGLKTWNYKIDGNVFSHMVIRKDSTNMTEDVIIGCNNKKIYCLAVGTSSSAPILKYSVNFESPIFATPYCEGSIVIVADTAGSVSLLNSSNGKIYHSLKLNGEVFSSPVVAGEFLVVGCRDDNLYVIKINE